MQPPAVRGLRAESLQLNQLIPSLFVPRKGSELWNRVHQIERGSFWQLVGPSGSGKTSLFTFLAGINFNYSGALKCTGIFDSRDFKDLTETEWSTMRQSHLSFVFQDLKLIEKLSVRNNLELKSGLVGTTWGNETITQLASELEIDRLLHKMPATLSRGERQRVVILRALLQDFDFLILDEPFSHLDPRLALRAAQVVANRCTNTQSSAIILDLSPDELFPWKGRIYLAEAAV